MLRRIGGDEKGAGLIELGLFLPVGVLLLLGSIDLANGLSRQFSLQQAVNRSLEVIQARPALYGAKSSNPNYTAITADAAQAAGVAQDKVYLQRWLECDGKVRPINDECSDGEGTARYLRLGIRDRIDGWIVLRAFPVDVSGTVRTQ